jgi:hypothetical protein
MIWRQLLIGIFVSCLTSLILSGCVPTVNSPLILGKPLSNAELDRFAGKWKIKTSDNSDVIFARIVKEQLIFEVREADGATLSIPVSVQMLSEKEYIFNADVTKIAPPLKDKTRRFVTGMAYHQNDELGIQLMREDALLKLVKNKSYVGMIENQCTGESVTAQSAKRPPATVTDPCFHLRLSPKQLLNLIATHGSELYRGPVSISLSR